MKLINSTDWPDYFLRRLVSWCCRELELSPTKLRECAFRNSRASWGGLAYWRSRIGVRVGKRDGTIKHWKFNDGFQIVTNDRIEILVAVTAHELAHIEQFWRIPHRRKKLERRTEAQAARLLGKFRESRERLLAEWSAAPAERPAKPKPSVQEQRSAKAQADLDRWQRKLKLAQTKVRKLKTRVRYYEQTLAAKRSTP